MGSARAPAMGERRRGHATMNAILLCLVRASRRYDARDVFAWSERNVDGGEEARERRNHRLIVRGGVVVLAFGIDALVPRPRVQLAAREREGRAAEAAQQLLRHRVRQRDLA